MPALVLFGRRWLLASDDIPPIAGLLAFFHLVWCGLLVGWLISIHGPAGCAGVWRYDVAAGGLLGSFALSVVLEVWAVAVGMRGSIFETRKRAAMPRLIYANVISVAAQVAFNGYGTYLIYSDPPRCEDGEGGWDVVGVMQGLVWSTWAVIAGLLLVVVLAYNLFPDYSDAGNWRRRCHCLRATCCCWLPRFRGGRRADGHHAHYRSTADRLGDLFAVVFGHIDMAPTDMLVASLLALTLQRIQRNRAALRARAAWQRAAAAVAGGAAVELAGRQVVAAQQGARGASPEAVALGRSPSEATEGAASEDALLPAAGGRPAPGRRATAEELQATASFVPRRPPYAGGGLAIGAEKTDGGHVGRDTEPTVDLATITQAAHFMKFAFAAYGALLYIWANPAMGPVDLCFGRACGVLFTAAGHKGKRARRAPSLRVGTNMNREAVLQAAGLAESDLIHVRFEGEQPDVLPYFVAVDAPTTSVVVAIRGSLSLEDVVRDLLFDPADLGAWLEAGSAWEEPPPTVRMAGPDARCSAHGGIMEAARATLADLQRSGALDRLLSAPGARCAGWRLVVTGHSLGAGCAFLLGLYLRQHFPGVVCWAFSPPGGLASPDVAARAASWCTSVVCGQEWIPRLTLRTFDRLRDELVFAAVRCRLPKARVVAGLVTGHAWGEGELFHLPAEVPEEPSEALHAYATSLARGDPEHSPLHAARLFVPPGRVLLLKPVGSVRRGRRRCLGCAPAPKERQYRPVWTSGQAVIDEGIVLSGRMMSDHMPDYLLTLLRRTSRALRRRQSVASMGDEAGQDAVDAALRATLANGASSSVNSGAGSGTASGAGSGTASGAASGRIATSGVGGPCGEDAA